jgi:hypothetical protein
MALKRYEEQYANYSSSVERQDDGAPGRRRLYQGR